MSTDKITRLATEALELKKAWVMGIALTGKPTSMSSSLLDIPNFLHWQNKALRRLIDDLHNDIDTIGKLFLSETWTSAQRKKSIPWLAQKHDEWMRAKQPSWEIGRVHEVEKAIGRLGFRKRIECPAYAQVLVQAFFGAAIRHPEYHLARDLALLTNLFLDAEAIADEHLRNKKPHSNENSQSLARSVILTCYNLLESFVSGLAAAFIIENPNAPEEIIKKLQKPKDRSLKAKFKEFPTLVTGVVELMAPSETILSKLFGDHQLRRNAFVHCEPGPSLTNSFIAKETYFHETDAKVVKETVSLTITAIRAAWKAVHKTNGPRWLPDPDTGGRFPRIDVKLAEIPSLAQSPS